MKRYVLDNAFYSFEIGPKIDSGAEVMLKYYPPCRELHEREIDPRRMKSEFVNLWT